MDFKISFYHDKLIRAENDLYFYKDLIPTQESGKYLSYTRKFPYEADFQYLEDSLKEGRQQNRLTFGFRCWLELGAAIGRANEYGGIVVYIKIPKGSNYYCNEITSEVCADTIVIEHECWKADTLIKVPYIQADFDAVPTEYQTKK